MSTLNHNQEIGRRSFIGKLAMGITAISSFGAFLAACGKSDATAQVNSQAATVGGDCAKNGTSVFIEVVHAPNHTLDMPETDVAKGLGMTYTLADNGSGHTHEVTFS